MAIELHPVKSSNVAAIGHDPELSELHVRYKSGPDVYVYRGVSADQHKTLLQAESIGGHIAKHIKPRHYAAKRS